MDALLKLGSSTGQLWTMGAQGTSIPRAMTSIFMTQISSLCILGIITNVIRALDVNRRTDRTRLGVGLDCPKYGYNFGQDGIIAFPEHDNLKIVQQKNLMAAHDEVNLPITLKGGSLTRSLRFARSGEQPRDVSDKRVGRIAIRLDRILRRSDRQAS